jgi:quercetin dioxygenase-like cupin family protein
MQTTEQSSTRTQTTTPAAASVVALGPDEGEAIWFLDNLITVKASARDGAPFGVVESRLPAGSSTPFHVHAYEDEALYVLEGSITIYLEGGRVLERGPGSFVRLGRGVAHGFRARTALRLLVLSDPRGFIDMVREAGMEAPRRELPPPAAPDVPRLEAACQRQRITLLGPLPDGQ